MAEFEWPCWKRFAHGAHLITVHTEESVRLTDQQLAKLVIQDVSGTLRCPGVRAHPDTLIGRIG